MLEVITLSLATWRLASLLASEAGPFNVFARLRHLAGVRYDDEDRAYGTNELARGLVCVWCCSVWIGLGAAAGYYFVPTLAVWLALPLALSAGAVLVEEMTHGES